MITIVKQDPRGNVKLRYQGEVVERFSHGIVVQASWKRPSLDLGYTRFETGDLFTEYYYTDRWFNIFDITRADGTRKGWYCNITEPALISETHVEQIDLLLDVWVSPEGTPLILDEDEFAADTMLSDEQRHGAQQALQALLHMLATRQEVFSTIVENT